MASGAEGGRDAGRGSATDDQSVAQACAAALLRGDESSRQLGIELVEVQPGRAVTTMTLGPAMANGFGISHGGYLFLLADTAFAFACNAYDQVTVAHSAQIVFARPGRIGDVLVATAEERLRYGRNGVYDVTIRRSDGEVVAEFRGSSRSLGRPILGETGEGGQGGGGGTKAVGHEREEEPGA